MTSPSKHWLQTGTGRIQKWHLFLMLFLVLPNAARATDCLVSPVLPCTFTLTDPFNGANWPTQPIDFRYDGGFAMVKTAKMVNGSGAAIPFQWVSSCWDPTAILGCIEIQDALPAGATQIYTLEAGPPSASVTNPVVVTYNVPCYSGGATCIQLSNGLTGVQVPTMASNGSAASYRLAPIQAIGLPNGGWTGAIGGSGNPNLIYTSGITGRIPSTNTAAILQTPITSATSYIAKFLDSGPLKTTMQLSYSFNRPDYWSNGTSGEFYYGVTCTAAGGTYPYGYVTLSNLATNSTVKFEASSCGGSVNSTDYYTPTPVPGVSGAYTLSVGSTPVTLSSGSGTVAYIISSGSGCSSGCQNAAPGHLTVNVTLYADAKSILIDEDSDMLHAEYYPFYNEIQPDTARTRKSAGTGASDPRCGYMAPISVTATSQGSTTASITGNWAAYSAGTTYQYGSVVTDGGEFYFSIQANNIGNNPPSSSTYWQNVGTLNGQFILLTGVGSGSDLPNGAYYLQTTSPYSTTNLGVWTTYSGGTFSGATTAPGSYSSGGLIKIAANTTVFSGAVADTGFDYPWAYGDPNFSAADPDVNGFVGCEISGGHLISTPQLVINYPASDQYSVWAWENYQVAGSGSSPVFGWYTGDASLMQNSEYFRMPGLYAAASGFVSGWGKTTAIEDLNLLDLNGIPNPTIDNWGSQKSWAIFVDTNANLPAFSASLHPPIQDDQNKYTGVNLSHLQAYKVNTPNTPSGGWKWLYMANSDATNAGQEVNCLISRVKDGSSTCGGMFPDGRTATPCSTTVGSSCYHDLLYNNSATDAGSQALLNMWQEEVWAYPVNVGLNDDTSSGVSSYTQTETVAGTGDFVVTHIRSRYNSAGTSATGCTVSARDEDSVSFTPLNGGNFAASGSGYSYVALNGSVYVYDTIFTTTGQTAGSHTITYSISGTGCEFYYPYSGYWDLTGGTSLDTTASTYLTVESGTSVNLTSGTVRTAGEQMLAFWFNSGGTPSIAAPFTTNASGVADVYANRSLAALGQTVTASITQVNGSGFGFVLGVVPGGSQSPLIDAAISTSGCATTASDLDYVLAAGNNHLDPGWGYYQGISTSEGCFAVWNAVLMDSNSTAAQQAEVYAEAAFFGGLVWDNSWFGWDNQPSDGQGTANQAQMYPQDRSTLAYQYGVNGANPQLATKVATSLSTNAAGLVKAIGCNGAMTAGPHYEGTYEGAFIPAAQITALEGLTAIAGQCQISQGFPNWMLTITTPPDPRFGNLRKVIPLGDTTVEEGNLFAGILATDLYATNATTAGWMSWLWHQFGTSTFQYLNGGWIDGLLFVDETIPQVTPTLKSQQISGDFAVHRFGTLGGGCETAVWFINGGNPATQLIYYDLSDHRHFDDGHIDIFACGAPLSMDFGADLYNPDTQPRFYHSSVTFDGEIPGNGCAALSGCTWSSNAPSNAANGYELLASPTVTAGQFFGLSAESAATYTYSSTSDTGGDGTVWTRTVRTMAPDANYPIIYVKDTFAGGSGGYKTLTWNLEATGSVTTPSGAILPTTSFSVGCPAQGPYTLPSNGTVYSLANGLQQFTFTGWAWPQYSGSNLKWNLYERPASGSAQFMLGNWGNGCISGFEAAEFKAANSPASWYGSSSNACGVTGNNTGACDWQHILRVHDTGPFETVITPTVASGTQPSVSYSGGVYTAAFGSNESLAWNDSYSAFTNGVAQILTTYNSSAQSAFGMTASGGPQEIANNGAGTITWTIDDVNPATRALTLPPGVWYPSVPVQESAGVYAYYHGGGAEPSPAVVTFTQTPATLRSVPLNYSAPPGATQIRVKFGSSTSYAATAACNPLCSIVMQSPLGTWQEQHDFLDGNGNVITSSQVRNVVIQ
jgi:hypothetical protein